MSTTPSDLSNPLFEVSSTWFDGFEKRQFNVNGLVVCARLSANWLNQMDKPVLVLLHGFPQTHVMWHRVAQALKNDYRLAVSYTHLTLPTICSV